MSDLTTKQSTVLLHHLNFELFAVDHCPYTTETEEEKEKSKHNCNERCTNDARALGHGACHGIEYVARQTRKETATPPYFVVTLRTVTTSRCASPHQCCRAHFCVSYDVDDDIFPLLPTQIKRHSVKRVDKLNWLTFRRPRLWPISFAQRWVHVPC